MRLGFLLEKPPCALNVYYYETLHNYSIVSDGKKEETSVKKENHECDRTNEEKNSNNEFKNQMDIKQRNEDWSFNSFYFEIRLFIL